MVGPGSVPGPPASFPDQGCSRRRAAGGRGVVPRQGVVL